MKILALLTLATCLTSAYAGEEFGGITFDSSVPADQVSTMKQDLTYLYQNPISINDEEFLKTTKLKGGTGEHLHNYILNRAKYIVGEDFDLETKLKPQSKLFFDYPETPMPDGISFEAASEMKTVMTNIGGALYLFGKAKDILIGLDIDGEVVSVKSTRTGILQVGEGLFYEGFLINKTNPSSVANSISRLGTLFHEARHSDGNGKSTGFTHKECPAGHVYAGEMACEASGNGSYTVGALSERHMLKNCSSCSTEEKTILSAAIADSFDRVFDVEKAKVLSAVEMELRSSKKILEMYLTYPWPSIVKDKIDAEVEALKVKIAELEAKRAGLSMKPDTTPAFLDDAAEGSFKELAVDKTSKLMKKSLKK